MEPFLVSVSVLIIASNASPKHNSLKQLFDHLLEFCGVPGFNCTALTWGLPCSFSQVAAESGIISAAGPPCGRASSNCHSLSMRSPQEGSQTFSTWLMKVSLLKTKRYCPCSEGHGPELVDHHFFPTFYQLMQMTGHCRFREEGYYRKAFWEVQSISLGTIFRDYVPQTV